MVPWGRPVSFVNARVVLPDRTASAVRFTSTILGVDGDPEKGDVVVDLNGAFVLPGLINAHDHLELNHYGRLKAQDRYVNATAWIDDMRPMLREDLNIRKNMGFPLADRLFIGGLKNLLAGVTTVAHHNPRYREIGRSFPVRVVKKYGWAHSFALQTQPVGARGELGGLVAERGSSTPSDRPFIIHVGEGTDEPAAAELPRLEALGCLLPNTILVHGVALTPRDWSRVVERGASLVWCPASNAFLFGTTPPVRAFLDASAGSSTEICLGSDSRITGARDMLDELRVARDTAALEPRELLASVTAAPARALRLGESGRIAVGVPADFTVLPPLEEDPAETLLAAWRRDISLVTIGGRPLVGAPEMRTVFAARRTPARPIVVDGFERLAESRLAGRIARCPIEEPGVACLS